MKLESAVDRRTPRLELLLAAALFSTGGIAIKACSLDGWQVASFRSGLAALTLAVLLPRDPGPISWRPFGVGIAYAATLILFVAANKLTTAANTIFLQSTAPLYMLLLAPLVLAEPNRRIDLLFMATLVVGLALFFVGSDPPFATAPDPVRGNLLAALSGLTWALTVGGLRWVGTREEGSTRTALVAGNVLAFLVCLPASVPLAGSTPVDWVLIVYLGAVQVGLAYVLMSRGVRGVPAVEASLLLLLEPALASLWAGLAYGERPGALSLAGCVIILVSTGGRTWLETRVGRRNLR